MISLSLLLTSHPSTFQRTQVRSFTACYRSFNLLMSRSPPLRVYCPRLDAPFALAFASPPSQKDLGLPRTITRRLIMQKAGRHPARRQDSDTLYAHGFRYYFTPLIGVLFTFPSRYWFTIGCQVVFSLIRWSGLIRAEFHVFRTTWDTPRGCPVFAHPAVTVYGRTFQIVTLTIHLPHWSPTTPEGQVPPV